MLAAESSWYSSEGYAPGAADAGAGPRAAGPVVDTDAGDGAAEASGEVSGGVVTLAVADVDLAEDVRRIAVDLEHSSPRTLRDRVLPRSVLRPPTRG